MTTTHLYLAGARYIDSTGRDLVCLDIVLDLLNRKPDQLLLTLATKDHQGALIFKIVNNYSVQLIANRTNKNRWSQYPRVVYPRLSYLLNEGLRLKRNDLFFASLHEPHLNS